MVTVETAPIKVLHHYHYYYYYYYIIFSHSDHPDLHSRSQLRLKFDLFFKNLYCNGNNYIGQYLNYAIQTWQDCGLLRHTYPCSFRVP